MWVQSFDPHSAPWAWDTSSPRHKEAGTWPPPLLHLCSGVGGGARFLHCRIRAVATGHGGSVPTVEASLDLSLLYVSERLFHLMLDCIVFSLATVILRCSGLKYLECSPGIVNRCMVLCLTKRRGCSRHLDEWETSESQCFDCQNVYILDC